jgi:hypothetical protein
VTKRDFTKPLDDLEDVLDFLDTFLPEDKRETRAQRSDRKFAEKISEALDE